MSKFYYLDKQKTTESNKGQKGFDVTSQFYRVNLEVLSKMIALN